MNTEAPKTILFVCLGNICRSPTGEGLLLHLLNEQGNESKISVDSAGTAGYHIGKQADPRMRAAAERRGYKLLSRSRKLSERDLNEFDLIIAMDRENFADIELLMVSAVSPKAEVKMLSDFLGDEWPTDVPDPYYGGEEGFEYVIDMIEAACPAIVEHFLNKE